MKTIKNMHLRVENFTLKKKLVKLDQQHKEDIEIINYLSNELSSYYNNFDILTDELRVEIQDLMIKVNNMI